MRFVGDGGGRAMRLLKSRRWIVVYAAAFAVIAVFASGALNGAYWVGRATIPLQFVVLDATTGRPIEGAMVRLMNEGNEETPEYEAVAGPDGRAGIVVEAMSVGRESLFRTTRGVRYRWLVVVAAGGYPRTCEFLASLTRDPAYHSDPVPPPIVIRLAPTPGRDESGD